MHYWPLDAVKYGKNVVFRILLIAVSVMSVPSHGSFIAFMNCTLLPNFCLPIFPLELSENCPKPGLRRSSNRVSFNILKSSIGSPSRMTLMMVFEMAYLDHCFGEARAHLRSSFSLLILRLKSWTATQTAL